MLLLSAPVLFRPLGRNKGLRHDIIDEPVYSGREGRDSRNEPMWIFAAARSEPMNPRSLIPGEPRVTMTNFKSSTSNGGKAYSPRKIDFPCSRPSGGIERRTSSNSAGDPSFSPDSPSI